MSTVTRSPQAEFLLLCRMLARSAFQAYASDPNQFLYLVGTRDEAGTLFNVLVDAEDSMLDLVCGEYIPRHLSLDEMCSWVRVRLSRKPLWIFAE